MHRRRRHPLIRLVAGLQHWCFAPVRDAIRGQVNWGEWARALVVATLPALVSGVGVWGSLVVALGATAADAGNIFLVPWVASAISGVLAALASRNHRLHDGVPPAAPYFQSMTPEQESIAQRYGRQ